MNTAKVLKRIPTTIMVVAAWRMRVTRSMRSVPDSGAGRDELAKGLDVMVNDVLNAGAEEVQRCERDALAIRFASALKPAEAAKAAEAATCRSGNRPAGRVSSTAFRSMRHSSRARRRSRSSTAECTTKANTWSWNAMGTRSRSPLLVAECAGPSRHARGARHELRAGLSRSARQSTGRSRGPASGSPRTAQSPRSIPKASSLSTRSCSTRRWASLGRA